MISRCIRPAPAKSRKILLQYREVEYEVGKNATNHPIRHGSEVDVVDEIVDSWGGGPLVRYEGIDGHMRCVMLL